MSQWTIWCVWRRAHMRFMCRVFLGILSTPRSRKGARQRAHTRAVAKECCCFCCMSEADQTSGVGCWQINRGGRLQQKTPPCKQEPKQQQKHAHNKKQQQTKALDRSKSKSAPKTCKRGTACPAARFFEGIGPTRMGPNLKSTDGFAPIDSICWSSAEWLRALLCFFASSVCHRVKLSFCLCI